MRLSSGFNHLIASSLIKKYLNENSKIKRKKEKNENVE